MKMGTIDEDLRDARREARGQRDGGGGGGSGGSSVVWRNTRTKIWAALLVLGVLVWCAGQTLHRSPAQHDAYDDDGLLGPGRQLRVVDSHIDLPFLARFLYKNRIYGDGDGFPFDSELLGQVDLPRLRAGKVGGVIWSVFVPCPGEFQPPTIAGLASIDTAHSPARQAPAALGNGTGLVGAKAAGVVVLETLQQIDVTKRIAALYSADMALVSSAREFAHELRRGRVAGALGAEGLHQIGGSPAALRLYHALGVRYVTLTHACSNAYADSSETESTAVCNATRAPLHGDAGLSPAGAGMVREMNRLGMMVDLAHVSSTTMRAALKTSRAPVIFSHSGARAVHPHPRNVPDEVLDLLRLNGGVVQVVFLPEYLAADAEEVDVETVVDHVAHIVERIGWRHVGIGSDYDGMLQVPQGLPDVSSYPTLIGALRKRFPKVTRSELEGFAGKNLLRVWHDVEKVAQRLRHELPLEDELELVPPAS